MRIILNFLSNKNVLLLLIFTPSIYHCFNSLDIYSVNIILLYFTSILLGYVFLNIISRYARFQTPFFFLLFAVISTLNRVELVTSNIDKWTLDGGYTTIGNFVFNDENLSQYFLIFIIGIFSIFFSFIITNFLKSKYINLKYFSFNCYSPNAFNKRKYLFLFGTLITLILSYIFRIGVSGYQPIELPLHLSGLIFFLKFFIFPLYGWFLFHYACVNDDKKSISFFLFFNLLIGLGSTFFTLSKAMVIYSVLPYVLIMIYNKSFRLYTFRLKALLIFTSLILLPISYFGALYLRFMDDLGGGGFTFYNLSSFWESYSRIENSNFLYVIFNNLYIDISSRLTGGSELMAVIASNVNQPYSSMKMILFGEAGQFDSGMSDLISNIFDIKLKNNGDTFSGKSIGFWGILYLSKSYLNVFFLTLVYVYLVTYLEYLSKKYGNRSFSIGISFWLSYNVWESGFDLFVFMVPLLIAFLIFLNRKSFLLKIFAK